MSNYIQATIHGVDNSKQEMLIALLSESGYEGFEQEDELLNAFIAENDFDEKLLAQIGVEQGLKITTKVIAQQNWNAEWESGFQPVQVGEFAAIRASFHAQVPGVKHDIIITPKMSFGTGHHATTAMMIRRMQKIDFGGKTVFDFGTGTGVLAILAEKCGAANVLAMDNDQWSIDNATENVKENNCTRIVLMKADAPPANRKFDIILANINRNIILDNMAALVEALTQEGTILFSGLLESDEKALLESTEAFKLKPEERLQEGTWICIQFAYSPD